MHIEWATIQLLVGVFSPVIGFVLWLLKRELDRADKVMTLLGNHFQHDQAAQKEMIDHMQKTNEALSLLLDRSR